MLLVIQMNDNNIKQKTKVTFFIYQPTFKQVECNVKIVI